MKKTTASKESEKANQHEDYLQSIFDTIHEALIVLDKDLRVISANKTFYDTFKVKPKQTENVLVFELGNGQWNIAELRKLLEDILPTHNPVVNFRVAYTFLHIGYKVMLLNARQIRNKGQWKNRILLAIEDITEYDAQKKEKERSAAREKKTAENLAVVHEKIQESELKFKSLAENVPVLCWMAKADGYVFWHNPQWYAYTGTTASEMEGWGWQKVHHPDYLPKVLKQWKKSIKTASPFEMSYPLRNAKGEYRLFLTRAVPIFNSKGALAQWVGTNTDITDQKKAEEVQKRLAAIVETSDDAIIAKNLNGIITSWNKGAEKIFGYTEREMIGKSIRTIIPQELQKEEDKILAQLKSGIKIDHFETTRMRKDGSRLFVSITVSPIKDENGVIIGASKIARDITQEKQLQKQKDDFLGIASHELKTPVTSIKAYGQVLQAMFEKKGEVEAVKSLKKMDAQINKLTNLIGDLLDVTKIQSGRLEFHEDTFDFKELISEIADEIQLTTQKHTIVKKLESNVVIVGDRERFGQVLVNLLSNAIKYSPHTKKIIVSMSLSKDKITVCVRDFGVGIPKVKQEKVFEQFFRVSGPMHNTVPGLGLGLYISSEIVKRQGGKIWVESTVGKGSTFCFSIPLNKSRKSK